MTVLTDGNNSLQINEIQKILEKHTNESPDQGHDPKVKPFADGILNDGTIERQSSGTYNLS